jgi:hypothetical protein
MTELALRPALVRTGLDFAFEGFALSREAIFNRASSHTTHLPLPVIPQRSV